MEYRSLAPAPDHTGFWLKLFFVCLVLPFVVGTLVFLDEAYQVQTGLQEAHTCNSPDHKEFCSPPASFANFVFQSYIWFPLILPLSPIGAIDDAFFLDGRDRVLGWWLPYLLSVILFELIFSVLNEYLRLTTTRKPLLIKAIMVTLGVILVVAIIDFVVR